MDVLLAGVFNALLSGAGTLGLHQGAKRATNRANSKVAKALEGRLDSARTSLLAAFWNEIPERSTDGVLEFIGGPMGRHVLRTIVVRQMTRPADISTGHVADAVNLGVATEDEQFTTLIRLSMLLSQTIHDRDVAVCASALYRAVSDLTGYVVSQLKALSPQEYRFVHDNLMADRQADLILNVARSNGTLQDLVHADANSVLAFAVRMLPLINEATASVAAPYFQKRPAMRYDEIYVAPVLLRSSSLDSDLDDERNTWSTAELLENTYRSVILGNPGAGKSTIMRFLAHLISQRNEEPGLILPFLVSAREYDQSRRNRATTLCEYIAQTCRSQYQIDPPPSAIEFLCATGRAVVLLDGLDEVLDPQDRVGLVSAMHNFAALYPAASILVTSRVVGYDQAPLYAKLFEQVTLLPFNEEQVKDYAIRWFGGEEGLNQEQASDISSAFLSELMTIGEDLRHNPLTLSLLCNVYRRIRSIPQNRAELYEDCSNLLFEAWDRSRGIVSEGALRGEAREALQDVALWMYLRSDQPESVGFSAAGGLSGTVRRSSLKRRLVKYWRRRLDSSVRAEEMAESLISSWEGRAWILTDVGADLAEPLYGFTHQTFLEYFAATELVRRNPSAKRLASAMVPHLSMGAWDVVGEIAIQVLHRNVKDGGDKVTKRLLADSRVLEPHERSSVVAFICRHIDSLPLSARTARSTVREAVELYLEGNPPAARVPAWIDYSDRLWFSGFPGGLEEESPQDTSALDLGDLRITIQDLPVPETARVLLTLPLLALMRSQAEGALVADECSLEFVRRASDGLHDGNSGCALEVLLAPAQIDFKFRQVYGTIPANWNFVDATSGALPEVQARELCGALAPTNFLVAAMGARRDLLRPVRVLAVASGWRSLFISPPEWLRSDGSSDDVDLMSSAVSHNLDRLADAHREQDWTSVQALAAFFREIGEWLFSDVPTGWTPDLLANRLDRAWMYSDRLDAVGSLLRADAQSTAYDPDWGAVESPWGKQRGPLSEALDDSGLAGLFFCVMVLSEPSDGAAYGTQWQTFGELGGLRKLLNCRTDGVIYVGSPWPGAEKWSHYQDMRRLLDRWCTCQISFTE